MRCISWVVGFIWVLAMTGSLRAADIPTASPQDPGIEALADARQAVKAKRWPQAEAAARRAIAANPQLADAHNLLGYSLRWQGRYDDAIAAYGRVFEIDPNHLGAHEYIGQAYVKLGQRAKAQEHLVKLQALCARCEETRDLAAALAR
jgi:tetratricopeptide (TPR) repeat protein